MKSGDTYSGDMERLRGGVVSRRFKIIASVFGVLIASCFVYLLLESEESPVVIVACVLVCVFVAMVASVWLSPDNLRSQYAERTLAIASDMLEDLRAGLTPASAQAICRRLLPETRAITVAITDTENVLACEGAHATDYPAGSPIHTPATRYALEHGLVQSFSSPAEVLDPSRKGSLVYAGIIAPLKVRGKAVGTLKFYFGSPRSVNRTQYALATGFADLISTQLASFELERQDELCAQAELRALQAQINPHFLFNTLNTIASFTRTDPNRARVLLREFAQFYRSTLDNSGSLIPVQREVEQTRRYLTFEKARFGEDRIQDVMTIEPDVEDTLVPAFVIQPLVENAVRHAMKDEGALRIFVSVRADGPGAVLIQVSDDGAGMDEQTAARLFDQTLPQPSTANPHGGGAGVALRNISERIKRFYGPGSSAKVESVEGEGTRISLHLDLSDPIFS
ncbi:MAG: histidine kinase [Coriobacteriaceae bacterium]|nr:histidine kinase [Coriobacteriaceae bacterium]